MSPSSLVLLFGATAVLAVGALFAVLRRKGRTEDRARAYLAGFTYVLSDDPDAAIAELSRAAELSTQTLETYFALGALFRRKGDLERAIRLHRNILLRTGLDPEVRRRALLALAVDYQRSGLKDKAAETLERLLADAPDHRDGLECYRQLLEEQGEWGRAIEQQARLVKLDDGQGKGLLAHLLAAHARAIAAENPDDAEELAQRAVELSPGCADAQLSLAQVRLGRGDLAGAAGPLEQAVALEPELAPGLVPQLLQVLPAEHVERALKANGEAREASGAPYLLALALCHKKRGAVEQAISQLRRLVEKRPWFWEARKELGVLLLAQDRSEELRADYQEILATLGAPMMGFACTACRQKLPEHAFRCPSCGGWDTVRREEHSSPGSARKIEI